MCEPGTDQSGLVLVGGAPDPCDHRCAYEQDDPDDREPHQAVHCEPDDVQHEPDHEQHDHECQHPLTLRPLESHRGNPAQRIQFRRTKGWRKPEGAIVVARPSKWGNPFKVAGPDPRQHSRLLTRADAVELFRQFAVGHRYPFGLETIRAELAGHDLACWCRLDQPCHADVLLELANGGTS